ncbi:MAG: PIG-L family deacetylase [Chloroflexota bacterium]
MNLFLSPHLDDAVFSCGGLIHQLTRQHESAAILTVMAGDPPDPLPLTPLVSELHERWAVGVNPVAARRKEDRAAAGRLRATVIHWPVPDCVYRTHEGVALYPSGDGNLFGPVIDGDPARLQLQSSQAPDAETVYIPLGVGRHVDHVIVRQWALDTFSNKTVRIIYYEDYPYSSNEQALAAALDEFNVLMREKLIFLDEADFAAKVEAAAAYQSQISTFWPDVEHMRAALYRQMYHPESGRLVERYWHA